MAFDAYSAPAPVEHPALARARLHRNLSALVERLIGMLDDLGGDPDLEDGADDEPSLSFQEAGIRIEGWYHVVGQDVMAAWLPNGADDREEEDEHDEPSLCGTTVGAGDWRDLEAACEDEGAVTGDDEPEQGE